MDQPIGPGASDPTSEYTMGGLELVDLRSGSLFLGSRDEHGVVEFLLGAQVGCAWDLSGDTWTVDDVELRGGFSADSIRGGTFWPAGFIV